MSSSSSPKPNFVLCNFSWQCFSVYCVRSLKKDQRALRPTTRGNTKVTTEKKGGQAYLDFPDVQQCIGMSGHKSRSVSLAFAHWACCDRDETVPWDTNEWCGWLHFFHCVRCKNPQPCSIFYIFPVFNIETLIWWQLRRVWVSMTQFWWRYLLWGFEVII